ncbi:MAG: flagellar protein FliS [Phycisphaerae bacterium]|nr:flagellar protein FliS [Phycisphaerae bacterium]
MPETEHGQLFLLLYENAIRYLNQAVECWRLESSGQAVDLLRRAADILRELDAGVDLSSGRQTASDLHRIYGFLLEQLQQAELTGDAFLLREITRLLEELHQSWKVIAG